MLNLLEWAERFISTPSVSADGNTEIAARACELLAEIGLEARREPTQVDGVLHETVIADLGPRGADGLLLLTHLDTVPPGDPEAWTSTGSDPWKPTREELYGLGSADAKVDFVCKVVGLAGVDRARIGRPVRVIGSFGEEVGLLGARWLIDHGLAEGFRYALVGEPSELVAIHAHKGRRVYEARIPLEPLGEVAGRVESQSFAGRSAHSSSPQLGANAIDAALGRLARSDVVGLVDVDGGEAVNKVPERCALELLVEDVGAGAAASAWRVAPVAALPRGPAGDAAEAHEAPRPKLRSGSQRGQPRSGKTAQRHGHTRVRSADRSPVSTWTRPSPHCGSWRSSSACASTRRPPPRSTRRW